MGRSEERRIAFPILHGRPLLACLLACLLWTPGMEDGGWGMEVGALGGGWICGCGKVGKRGRRGKQGRGVEARAGTAGENPRLSN